MVKGVENERRSVNNFLYFQELDENSAFAWLWVCSLIKMPPFFAFGVSGHTKDYLLQTRSSAGPKRTVMNHLGFDSSQIWGQACAHPLPNQMTDGAA